MYTNDLGKNWSEITTQFSLTFRNEKIDGEFQKDYDKHAAWKKLVATIPVYTTWDDHDYFNDDLFNVPEGYTQKDKEAVCKIFREKGNFLGDKQMKWFEKQLLDCKDPFIILSSLTMWSDYVSEGKDSWGVYDPGNREKNFNITEKNKIGGVLLISGDRHGTRGFTIPRPSGFNFYEFETGSLGGRVCPHPIRANWKTQLYGISGEPAFGQFSFDTTLADPEVTFRLIHESGTVYYEIILSRS